MKENEYLLVYYDDENGIERLSAQYCMEGGKLRKFGRSSINFRSKKSADKNVSIKARNDEQICAIDLMKDRAKTIKLIEGS